MKQMFSFVRCHLNNIKIATTHISVPRATSGGNSKGTFSRIMSSGLRGLAESILENMSIFNLD